MQFVVQEHRGRSLHYDFRLEIGGVLKSWAVPKGPSTDPREKRLAVRTPDHALGYEAFEGVIEPGEYGAGSVIVWDTGPYRNLTERDGTKVPLEEAIERGHVAVWLEGEKLRGGYALTRVHFPESAGEDWLLIKEDDEFADPARDPVRDEPRSVLTGRTTDDVQRGTEGESHAAA